MAKAVVVPQEETTRETTQATTEVTTEATTQATTIPTTTRVAAYTTTTAPKLDYCNYDSSHCIDKLKNCDETGVDCGGSCPSCTPAITGRAIMYTGGGLLLLILLLLFIFFILGKRRKPKKKESSK